MCWAGIAGDERVKNFFFNPTQFHLARRERWKNIGQCQIVEPDVTQTGMNGRTFYKNPRNREKKATTTATRMRENPRTNRVSSQLRYKDYWIRPVRSLNCSRVVMVKENVLKGGGGEDWTLELGLNQGSKIRTTLLLRLNTETNWMGFRINRNMRASTPLPPLQMLMLYTEMQRGIHQYLWYHFSSFLFFFSLFFLSTRWSNTGSLNSCGFDCIEINFCMAVIKICPRKVGF